LVTFEQKTVIQVPYSRVFAVNSDVGGWKTWDPGIKESSLEGPFASGAKGYVKLKNGPVIEIDIVEVINPEWIAVEARVKLCRIRYEQNIIPAGTETKVRCKVMLSGPLSSLYGSVMGQEINLTLLRTLAGLKSFCESHRLG
jgi:hypothetical protein